MPSWPCDAVNSTAASKTIGRPAGRLDLHFYVAHPVGYIIPKAEWNAQAPWLQDARKAWYGEVNSPGPETAPRIVGAVTELLKAK